MKKPPRERKFRVFICLLPVFLLFTNPQFISAQSPEHIEGRMINAETQRSVSYGHIFIFDRNIGTVSNGFGMFRFPSAILQGDPMTIRFSAIGYYSVDLSTDDLLGMDEIVVELRPRVYELEEAVVEAEEVEFSKERITNRGFRSRTFGARHASGGFSRPVENVTYIKAQRVDIDEKKPVRLTSIEVRISSIGESETVRSFQSAEESELHFRLRIMNADENGNPGYSDLMPHDVRLQTNAARQTLKFDISEYDVFIEDGSFYFVIEKLVPDLSRFHGYYPMFATEEGPHPHYLRFRTFQQWGRGNSDRELGYEVYYEVEKESK